MSRASIGTIKWFINGTSFADAGISDARLTRASQTPDAFDFTVKGGLFSADSYAYLATITITRQNGSDAPVKVFVGKIAQSPTRTAGDDSIRFHALGGWWWFERATFEQKWAVKNATTSKTTVILGQAFNNTGDNPQSSHTTGEVIASVVDWAISAGAQIAKGTIDSGFKFPAEQCRDLTCAEAIKKMMRWMPDAVAWFDYSTTPYPTFHCRKRANLSESTIAISGQRASGVEITAREDLKPAGVKIIYEITETVDGTTYEKISTDTAGDTSDPFTTLRATVSLKGPSTSYVSQYVKTEAILETNANWWKKHDPSLASIAANQITISSGSVTKSEGETRDPYGSELVEGGVADWMPCHTAKAVVTAWAKYTITHPAIGSGGNLSPEQIETVEKAIQCEIITCNATSGVYRAVSESDAGEPVPTGLAAGFFASLSTLQYEGEIELSDGEVPASGMMGMVLNLTGGRTEWATMRALVQQTSEDIMTGKTSVSFGPPAHLSIGDLVDLLRASRNRVIPNRLERATGSSSTSGSIQPLPTVSPSQNAVPAHRPYNDAQFETSTGKTIKLTPKDFSTISWVLPESVGELTLKPRIMNVCTDNGPKRIVVLCSEEFAMPTS